MRFVVRMALVVAAVVSFTATAQAEWKMEIESRTVYPGQQDVSLKITYFFDIKIVQSALPVVVREVVPGSFWTGTLPHDTTDSDGIHYRVAVTWGQGVEVYSYIILEWRGGPGCEGSGPYDGISPDHFTVNNHGGVFSARPNGHLWVTIQFDVTDVVGQFEFDTACFSTSLHKIFMIDGNYPNVDHGPPPGTNDVQFIKGVVTIAPCDCGVWGDVTGDGMINPADAVSMVNYVYKSIDTRVLPPNCPYSAGDVNCDGTVSPADNVLYTQYVYNGRTPFPTCDACEGY